MYQNNRVVLLLSGGIDSTVLLYWLIKEKYEVFPLIINYGQVTYNSEYQHSVNILNDFKMKDLYSIDVSQLSKIGKGALTGQYPDDLTSNEEWYDKEFFPNRNLILLTLASNYAYKINADNLAIGLVGDSYRDTSMDFLNSFKDCLEKSLIPMHIIAPFTEKKREEVIKQAIDLRVPLNKTFSCNALSGRHCQLCNSCYERQVSLNMFFTLEH